MGLLLTGVVAACLGAVVGHTVFGAIGNADTALDRTFLLTVVALTTALGFWTTRPATTAGPKSPPG